MTRPSISRNVAAAAVAACLSLVLPFLGSAGDVAGAAGSVTARAAQSEVDLDARPGDARFPVGSGEFQNAQRIATEVWGGAAPCKGQVSVTWERLDEGTNATASWRNPTDAWNNAGENFDCEVTLNTHAEFDFPKLCTVMAHELGHLLGKPHADVPGQLMSALYTDALPACQQGAPSPAPAATDESAAAASKRGGTATRKQSLRKAKTRTAVKRCMSRYSAGKRASRTKRCGKAASAKRAARSRR